MPNQNSTIIDPSDLLVISADNQIFKTSRSSIKAVLGENHFLSTENSGIVLNTSPERVRRCLDYIRFIAKTYPDRKESDALSLIFELKKNIQNEIQRCHNILKRRTDLWNYLHEDTIMMQNQDSFWNYLVGDIQITHSPYTLVGTKRLDDLMDQYNRWSKIKISLDTELSKEFQLLGLKDINHYYGYDILFPEKYFETALRLHNKNLDVRRTYAEYWSRDHKLHQHILRKEAYQKWKVQMVPTLRKVRIAGAVKNVGKICKQNSFKILKFSK